MPDVIFRKSFDCDLKAVDDAGAFDLYAAVFGNVDRQGEVIVPGAFQNLAEFVSSGCGLVNHGMNSLPVAWIDSAEQDAKGLRVRGRFHSTPEAQACRTVVLERMAAGKAVKCSIGFRVTDDALEMQSGRPVRRLKAINVYEFSFVNVPANPEAGVTSAKSVEADAMPESRLNFVEAIKEWLGLETKKGRSVSRANHEALTAFADAMDAHGKGSGEHVKALKGLAKALEQHGAMSSKLAAEMRAFLAPHDPAAPPPADDDETDDDDEKAAKPVDRKDDDLLKRLRLRARV